MNDYKDRYCIDDGFMAGLKKAIDGKSYLFERWIDYVLVTGGNWAGGRIGDFRLVVDKGDPKALVSFCANGVKKISPTQFEVRKKDFKPIRDLNILLFDAAPQDESVD